MLLLGLTTQVLADDTLMLQVSEPKSPTNDQDFHVTFVVLDTVGGRDINVACIKEGSGVFYSTTLAAGGNTGSCPITAALVDKKGDYTITVNATAGASSDTKSVSFSYNNENPGDPRDYQKNKIGGCTYEIKFKTADDNGRTTKVEVYRSTDTSFKADNGSRVAEIGVGSNTEKVQTNDVPDCNKTYYYAIRSFSNAGGGSGIVGDKEIKIVETDEIITGTNTQTGMVTQAIPVTQSKVLGIGKGGETGKILGTETSTNSASLAGEIQANGGTTQAAKTGINWSAVFWLSAIGAVAIWGWRRLVR